MRISRQIITTHFVRFVFSVYPAEENPFAIDIYPNGAVRSDREEGCYFADAGAVDYEGLKAAMERLERMEQEKLQQGTDQTEIQP